MRITIRAYPTNRGTSPNMSQGVKVSSNDVTLKRSTEKRAKDNLSKAGKGLQISAKDRSSSCLDVLLRQE